MHFKSLLSYFLLDVFCEDSLCKGSDGKPSAKPGPFVHILAYYDTNTSKL